MKSRTRLDSAVFQLTPTRTRYTLVINSNGKTEKISSGLLNPFVAHLKAVQDQFARGCYSIMLEPNPVGDAIWFTKGTVQRFASLTMLFAVIVSFIGVLSAGLFSYDLTEETAFSASRTCKLKCLEEFKVVPG